jgi:hypothetical protein
MLSHGSFSTIQNQKVKCPTEKSKNTQKFKVKGGKYDTLLLFARCVIDYETVLFK